MRKRLIIGASLALVFASLVGLVQPGEAEAKRRHDIPKVTICHRTNSVTNPYVSISVNVNAADGISGNNFGHDHYGEHQGPVATSEAVAQELKDAKTKWGDIIPPIEGAHDGLNWTGIGQAIYLNDCNYVTTIAATEPTFTPPTCEADGSYVVPTTEGVEYSIDGSVVAADTYTAETGSTVVITATALKGYYIDGTSEWSYTFTAPVDCDDDDGEVLGETDTPPTALPITSGDMTIVGITLAGVITAIVTTLSFVARGILGRQL